MKWNFLYQIKTASRTPDQGGYRPPTGIRSPDRPARSESKKAQFPL